MIESFPCLPSYLYYEFERGGVNILGTNSKSRFIIISYAPRNLHRTLHPPAHQHYDRHQIAGISESLERQKLVPLTERLNVIARQYS